MSLAPSPTMRAVVRRQEGASAQATIARIARPAPPGPDWCLVRVTCGGVCGSDLKGLELTDPAREEPIQTGLPRPLPVMGHEVVGEVVVGPRARLGARVLVDPLVTCAARGLAHCPSCTRGWRGQCLRFWEPGAIDGKALGFTSAIGGGWAEYVCAHETMLRTLASGVSDTLAVIAEPLSVAIAALRLVRFARPAYVLVVGGGTLGLLTAFAAAEAFPLATRAIAVRHPFQAEAARQIGGAGLRTIVGDPVTALADAGHRSGSVDGTTMLLEGPDLVIDAVGSDEALRVALATCAIGGDVLTLGNPDQCSDLRPLWLKRLSLHGHLEHAHTPDAAGEGEDGDSLSEALRLLERSPSLARVLVTHHVPLDDYRRALAVASSKSEHRAIKVVLEP